MVVYVNATTDGDKPTRGNEVITTMCMNVDEGVGADYIIQNGMDVSKLKTAEVIVWGRMPNGVGTFGTDSKKTCVELILSCDGDPFIVEIGLDQLESVVRAFRSADQGDVDRANA